MRYHLVNDSTDYLKRPALTSVERDRARQIEAKRERERREAYGGGGFIEAIVETLKERPALTLAELNAEIDGGSFKATDCGKSTLKNIAEYCLRVARICAAHEEAKTSGKAVTK